jgi:RNA polymerase sigma-32 factor
MTAFSNTDRSLDRYVAEINRYPLLTREQEVELAERYRRDTDEDAAHRLVVCNLRFVVKTAHEYRGYGLKLLDLIQEGNIGLMIAVKKFDPSKGYRLVSYAVWWIRAYIQSFIMRAWSLVKVGTTQAQRKLFFRLRSERERADRAAGPGERATARQIADHLQVGESDVNDMEMRLGERDFSLDAKVVEGGRSCHLDLLAAGGENQEETYSSEELRGLLRIKVRETMGQLNDKERYVIENRIMRDEPPTLQEIGQHLKISRERVRQIEGNIIRKIRTALSESGVGTAAAAA